VKLRDALLLGRVSNLPTVWSNVLAGAVLAGATIELGGALLTMLALSLFYVGGMYLNDAFDRDLDARDRPERPIPSGRVEASTVFIAGFAMLLAGVLLLGFIGGLSALGAGLGLAGSIVLYDAHHKANPWSPVLMALCRVGVYLASALALAGAVCGGVLTGATLLFGWVVGLTYAAKQEARGRISTRWPLLLLGAPVAYAFVRVDDAPVVLLFSLALLVWLLGSLRRLFAGDVKEGVVRMIAGIALLDALLIASRGYTQLALLAVIGFALTRLLQRSIPGT
jgi:hypothetical protein